MYTIKQITDREIEAACTLWRESAPGVTLQEWETPEFILSAIKGFESLCLVAVENDEVLGAVLGGHFGMRGLVQHLAVDARHQRRGIATALMNACCESFRRRGIRRVLLGVNQPQAISFYQSVGFVTNDAVKLMWRDV